MQSRSPSERHPP